MARPLRIEFAGALYHVMSRGNERRPIVRDDRDCTRRLEWLQRTVETYGWRLHAFVLMSNHEHLFVETPEPNLSAGMQFLNGSYTSYFNRRHRRSGHLFQGRFKAHLIEEEGYFLEVSRYIHLNPVRAKLVRRPEEYRWSSYPGYRRLATALDWVTYTRVLGEFGVTERQSRRAYGQFVAAGVDDAPPSPYAAATGGMLVGSPAFLERIGRLLANRTADTSLPQLKRLRSRPPLEKIVAAVSRRFGNDPAAWSEGHRSDDASRAVAAYLARRRFRYSATLVAKALGYRGPSSVSHAVRRVEAGPANLRKSVSVLAARWE